MEWLLEAALKYPRRFAAVGTVIVLLVAGFIWLQAVWLSPGRAFEDMLANNLSTTSFTKHSKMASTQQSIEQTIRVELGGNNAVNWLVTAKQSGSSVTTEEIGTPSMGYLRYLAISAKADKAGNYSKLLNQWATSDGKTDTDLGQLFAGTMLDIDNAPMPPIGDLSPLRRENLLTFNRDNKVFTPDYTKVKTAAINGRRAYTYTVAVDLAAYVQLMKAFAHDLGLARLDQLDPSQYTGVKVSLSMSVDAWSHQLVQVTYTPSGFMQSYSDWGLQAKIVPPMNTISTTDLQRRLQAVAKT